MQLKVVDNIPKIWTRAYFLICFWYALNFAISAFFEWKLFRPFPYVLWGGFFLFEALCLMIILIFLYSHWLSQYSVYYQVAGHLSGIIIFFYVMGTLSWYFTDFLDGIGLSTEEGTAPTEPSLQAHHDRHARPEAAL